MEEVANRALRATGDAGLVMEVVEVPGRAQVALWRQILLAPTPSDPVPQPDCHTRP
jgi:hypothetical protein